VSTVNELTTALSGGWSRIVVAPGVYAFTAAMCSNNGDSALCISRSVTIEAAVPGTVVLEGLLRLRVMHISSGTVELIGLDITGGYALNVSFQNIP
jgi:hypothetical protein